MQKWVFLFKYFDFFILIQKVIFSPRKCFMEKLVKIVLKHYFTEMLFLKYKIQHNNLKFLKH